MSLSDKVVYFAHGKESGPWGKKITALAKIARKKGFQVESPDYSFTQDPEKRVEYLLSLKPEAKKFLILVGSSMGGYVSTVASARLKPKGLFLMAPAFYIPKYQRQNPKPKAQWTTIVHGWDDRVIPVENSIRFAKAHRCDLFILNSDHQLTSVLSTIESLFSTFLERSLR